MDSLQLTYWARLARRYALQATKKKNSCILTAKILMAILEREQPSLDLLPIAVKFTAMNPVMRSRWQSESPPQTDEEVREVIAAGGYAVAIPDEIPSGCFPHMVLGVSDTDGQCWIADPSIDQASRPEHGLNLSPIAFEIEDSLFDWDDSVVDEFGGSVVVYQRLDIPAEKWESSPDWNTEISIVEYAHLRK